MSLSQRTARSRDSRLAGDARAANPVPPPTGVRVRARVTANLTGGAYEVAIYDAAGAESLTDFRVVAFPATAADIAVDTYVEVIFSPGSPVGQLDGIPFQPGAGGSSIGGIVMVGGSGYISST